MNAQEMWDQFAGQPGISGSYEAWSFGPDPDELAQLVLSGIKTATSSAHLMYELEHLELPKVGKFSVILDGTENAVCIIQTIKVYVAPFEEVTEVHAFKEGEGDRSLQYWRSVHESFFREELENAGLTFHCQTKVVCEEFVRVFP